MADLKGIVMDVDGTILPTLLRQKEWFLFYGEQNEVDWPFDNFEQFSRFYNATLASDGVQAVYDALGLPCDMSNKSHPVWKAYNDFNEQTPAGLFEGMREALGEIADMKQYGLKVGLNTTNTLKSIKRDLEKANVFDMFDFVITADSIESEYPGRSNELMKPNTFTLAKALQYIGCSASEAMHIGDTRTDLVASHNVVVPGNSDPQSFVTVGCLYGYEKQGLREGAVLPSGQQVHFDRFIAEPRELPDVIRDYLCI